MIGDNEQGASFLTIGLDNFTDLISQPPFNILPPAQLRELYAVPEIFSSEADAVIALATDFQYRWYVFSSSSQSNLCSLLPS